MPKRKSSGRKSGKRQKRQQQDGVVVAKDGDGEVYWKVQAVVDWRSRKGRIEYLIRWENYEGDTWEPESNLCGSVLREAQKFRMREAEKKLGFGQQQEQEMGEGSDHDSQLMPLKSESQEIEGEKHEGGKQEDTNGDEDAPVDDRWDWSSAGQIKYREIERIDVNDPLAPQRVTDARLSGVPVCLVGHRGWAQFASRWLEPDVEQSTHDMEQGDDHLLDFSKPHRLNLEKMVQDLGSEPVPILRERDQGQDPNKKTISLEIFLKKCWPRDDRKDCASTAAGARLYLHQWQFPVSETAVSKLCGPGANTPLPNDILGEDLLRHWHEKERFMGDNPYQYIFMGREGTMSKLHCDKGALMITIAPIIGEKEVVLVHRADGPTSLYHLSANLDAPDLDRYPLIPTARTWRSVIRPGEILIMPQGTYHQCRNVTPCFSYHRFYLDHVNLKPFLDSCFDGDANEIDHDEILWNASFELRTLVDIYVDTVRSEREQSGSVCASKEIPHHLVRAVDTLRSLRNIAKEMELRLVREDPKRSAPWNGMVHDIDKTLHSFRYRFHQRPPKLAKRIKRLNQGTQRRLKEAESDGDFTDEENGPANTLRLRFRRSEKLFPEEEFSVIPDSVLVEIGDRVIVRLHGARLLGTIADIREQMKAVYIEYDEYDDFYSEFIPFDSLRVKVAGESSVGIRPSELEKGKIVYANLNGEPYRARVRSCRIGTFYRVSLELEDGRYRVDRWLSRDSFLKKTHTQAIASTCGSRQDEATASPHTARIEAPISSALAANESCFDYPEQSQISVPSPPKEPLDGMSSAARTAEITTSTPGENHPPGTLLLSDRQATFNTAVSTGRAVSNGSESPQLLSTASASSAMGGQGESSADSTVEDSSAMTYTSQKRQSVGIALRNNDEKTGKATELNEIKTADSDGDDKGKNSERSGAVASNEQITSARDFDVPSQSNPRVKQVARKSVIRDPKPVPDFSGKR